MANYENTESQLINEINDRFDKFNTQNSITKKDLISISRKFKKLQKCNKEKWGNLSTRINTLMRAANGLNPTSNFIKLEELHNDFKEKVEISVKV